MKETTGRVFSKTASGASAGDLCGHRGTGIPEPALSGRSPQV